MTRLLLLDTDVFSFLFKRDSHAAMYAPHLVNAQPCLSFQSVAELRYWHGFGGGATHVEAVSTWP